MLKQIKNKGYEAPTVEICTVESTMLCATSTTDFGNGGSLGNWDGDGVGTSPFTNGGSL